MLNTVKFTLAIGLAMPVLASCQQNNSMVEAMNKTECENKLLELIGTGSNKNIPKILELKSNCATQQVYYYALSHAYYVDGDYRQSIDVATFGLELPYVEIFSPTLYYTKFKSLIAIKDIMQAKQVVYTLKEKHPDSDVGYLMLGEISLREKNYLESISSLEKVRNEDNLFVSKHLLTVAYYHVNKFDYAVNAFESSVKINNSVYYERSSILAASASYYEIGNKQAALEVLNQHIAFVPESKSHPLVIKMYEILAQTE